MEVEINVVELNVVELNAVELNVFECLFLETEEREKKVRQCVSTCVFIIFRISGVARTSMFVHRLI